MELSTSILINIIIIMVAFLICACVAVYVMYKVCVRTIKQRDTYYTLLSNKSPIDKTKVLVGFVDSDDNPFRNVRIY